MFNLKMVDTAGGGIRKLFLFQRQRFFPMPDYDLSGNRVQIMLTGKVLDMDCARVLACDASLDLRDSMEYYLDLICKAVKEHGTLSLQDIDELLWNKLPDWIDDKQRKAKVGNLLTELRRGGKIVNRGSFAHPSWALVNAPGS